MPRIRGGLEPCTDARTYQIGTHDLRNGETAQWRFTGVAAETLGGIHRGASVGGYLVGHSRRARQPEPLSFCARLQAILRRASASLPFGPPDGSRQEPVAEASALGNSDRRANRLSRNKFIHAGISQIHGSYADRISAPAERLTKPK